MILFFPIGQGGFHRRRKLLHHHPDGNGALGCRDAQFRQPLFCLLGGCIPCFIQVVLQFSEADQPAPFTGHTLNRLVRYNSPIPYAAGIDVILHRNVPVTLLDGFVDIVHVICVGTIRLPASRRRYQQVNEDLTAISKCAETCAFEEIQWFAAGRSCNDETGLVIFETCRNVSVEGSGRSGGFCGFPEEAVNQGAIGVVKVDGQALCGNGKFSQCWLLHESTPLAFSILVLL